MADRNDANSLSISALETLRQNFGSSMTTEMHETVNRAIAANHKAMQAQVPVEERRSPEQAAYERQRAARRLMDHTHGQDR